MHSLAGDYAKAGLLVESVSELAELYQAEFGTIRHGKVAISAGCLVVLPGMSTLRLSGFVLPRIPRSCQGAERSSFM